MGTRKSSGKKLSFKELLLIIICVITVEIMSNNTNSSNQTKNTSSDVVPVSTVSFDLDSVPEYKDTPYVVLDNNIPKYTENDYTTNAFETYSELDSLGRCGVAYANICKEIMPANGEERQAINMIKPTGWKKTKYEGMIEGNYLYNRCHLIGYQLAAENANKKNLITGTRYFNVNGMLPFENKVSDYIKNNKKNHVLYRVTPIFKENNLVANGVQMEAYSVEDNGKGVCFNVYVYNVQPGIEINYATGDSKLKK